MNVESPIPLSLYIHFPWCVKKCPYCDFNSHGLNGKLPEQEYTQALIQQLSQSLQKVKNREIRSIFMGGGTPSLFSAKAISQVLDFLRTNANLCPDAEITLEANPGTVEQERFRSYRDIGINRISLGVQSFNDKQLKKLGRIHGADEAKAAIEKVIQAGFDNFNIDIMYGLVEQTTQEALNDLEIALSFSGPHLSWYQLTLEPNTYFYKHPPAIPAHDLLVEMEGQGRELLNHHGFHRYEISAYHKNRPCQHNLNYWQFGDYLGIGAGAHGKLTCTKTKQIIRTVCYKQPKQYMDRSLGFYQSQKAISHQDVSFEYMLNALRLVEGTDLHAFSKHTFQSLKEILNPLNKALEKKLIFPFEQILRPTPLGLDFLNDLTLYFLQD